MWPFIVLVSFCCVTAEFQTGLCCYLHDCDTVVFLKKEVHGVLTELMGGNVRSLGPHQEGPCKF